MGHDEDLIRALRTIHSVFSSLGIRYFISGSVASSFHGAMRSTMDVDIVAEVKPEHVKRILESIASEYYASESAICDAIERHSCFNLIHLPTSFKVDVFVSRGRPLDQSAFNRATTSRLGTLDAGIDVPIASTEDIILAKLEWYRRGNEVSERQWDDLRRLVQTNQNSLDFEYLAEGATQSNVENLLDRLRKELRI